MKKIICYGDSNTFGYNPFDSSRYGENVRWTSVLKQKLGTEFEIINEGICDRTGFVTNPKGFLFSAQKHFPKLISKSEKIDLLILWLGTNDLQFQYDISQGTIEKGLEKLINIAHEKTKSIIIIPPVILNEKVLEGFFNNQFDSASVVKSRKVGRIFRTLANIYQCAYFDINKITKPSDFDGLHYDEGSHLIIAEELENFIRQNF